VRLVSLSATVSNAEEFGDWLVTVRGDTDVVLRAPPVPLLAARLVGTRLHDLFVDDGAEQVNPSSSHRPDEDRLERAGTGDGAGLPPSARVACRAGSRWSSRLDAEGCCRDHVHLQPHGLRRRGPAVPARGHALNTARGAAVRERRAPLRRHPDEDLPSSATTMARRASSAGSRSQSRACWPTFKEVVEELFVRGWSKASSPPRLWRWHQHAGPASVVLERLVKWNGESHARRDAGEYTQLTGRGRSSAASTVEGHAVGSGLRLVPRAVAGLAVDPLPTAALELPAVVHMASTVVAVRRRAGAGAARVLRSRSSRPTGPVVGSRVRTAARGGARRLRDRR
jgi:ATP-dependent RNA helicase HelY